MTLELDSVSSAQLHDVAEHIATSMTSTRSWPFLSSLCPQLGPVRAAFSSCLGHVITLTSNIVVWSMVLLVVVRVHLDALIHGHYAPSRLVHLKSIYTPVPWYE